MSVRFRLAGAAKSLHLLARRSENSAIPAPEKNIIEHRADRHAAWTAFRRYPVCKGRAIRPLHPAKAEMAQDVRAMAPPRTPGKIVTEKVAYC